MKHLFCNGFLFLRGTVAQASRLCGQWASRPLPLREFISRQAGCLPARQPGRLCYAHALAWAMAALIFCGAAATGWAGTAEEDWQAIVALDAGPGQQPDSAKAAGTMVVTHLHRQHKALRDFLEAHPGDARIFEARLRLARVLQFRADFEGSEKMRVEARQVLDDLTKTATPEQRPELEFAKIARMMRTLRRADAVQREQLLQAARRFQSTYPNDRRVAALLAEVATLFDGEPKTKEILLEDALATAKDEELKARIADDLKRVRLVGQEVPLNFTSLQGQEIKAEGLRGKPHFVFFFATASPPAMTALGKLQKAVAGLPPGSVGVVAVSVDENRDALVGALKVNNVTWPVAFDGRGWVSPLVRGLGINAVPTVWLLDARGRLRSLNALDGAVVLAQQLLHGP